MTAFVLYGDKFSFGTMQGSPLAELNVTAKAASVCYYDAHAAGKDSDATNVDLRLRGKKLDLLFEIMDNAVAAKVRE